MHPVVTEGEQPVTVLTYHRIVEDAQIEQFYDVSISKFEQHVSFVAERSLGISDGLVRLEDGRLVCFTFDDGTSDHFHASEILADYGLVGTFFVVAGWLGSAGYLRATQLVEMAQRGHRIGSHSFSHPKLTDITLPEIKQELVQSKQCLESHCGHSVDWFAAPSGRYSPQIISAAQSLGYKVFRTMDWGYNRFPLDGKTKCLPVFRHYDAPSFARLVGGRAPIWRYAAKNSVKKLLPHGWYRQLREATAKIGDQF